MRDVLVIGAGPAGCVAASYLAKQGYSVTLVEKQKFPRFCIGESLLPISMEHFEEVGFLPALEAAKFEVKSGALFLRGKEEEMDISFDENFTPGWTWTWQVPRAEFDKILADETEKTGVELHYEATLNSLVFEGDQVQGSYEVGGVITNEQFRFVIDSSGNAGVLSKMLPLKVNVKPTNRKSLFTHVNDVRAQDFPRPRRISFDIVEQDLWFWVIPFSNGVTSLGFVGDKKWFEGLEDPNEQFKVMLQKSERFKKRFEGLEYLFDVKCVQDYTCNAAQLYGDKFVLVGNTSGFIDPVFSSGVALATSSGILAAKLLDRQLKGEKIDWQAAYVEEVTWASKVFSAFVEGWYDGNLHKIFFAPEIQMPIKEQITSVLAGYVWDKTNPFVKNHDRLIKTVAKVVDITASAV